MKEEKKYLSVAIFGHRFKDAYRESLLILFSELHLYHYEINVEHCFADYLTRELHISLSDYDVNIFSGSDFRSADLVVAIGGDGTFLHTASRVYATNPDIPMLGVNAGHLGFLADVSRKYVSEAFRMIAEGHYRIESRSLIKAVLGDEETAYFALNEIAVLKADISSLIKVRVEVDGCFLADYHADGLIVCTPTGSTGYSLSVGGPIISPTSQSFCISAVAPHSLSIRPVIINDSAKVSLSVETRNGNYLLAVDGESKMFNDNVTITLERAPCRLKVVKLEHQQFFDTLREKLKWA